MYNLFDEFLLSAKKGFEILSDFGLEFAEAVIYPVLKGTLWLLCFVTLPIWIIPFLIINKRREKTK